MGRGLTSNPAPTYLDRIIAHKREHRPPPASDLEQRLGAAPRPIPLMRTAGTYEAVLIAECKKASPSRGRLVESYSARDLAAMYVQNGAAAISVLTDEPFFQGSLEDLSAVRSAVSVPVLRKDFTLEESDILEARAAGADLVLLIARVLERDQLERFLQLTRELDMEAIVEVHDEADVTKALEASAECLGVNNRDLQTFAVDLMVTERLMGSIPRGVRVISESGLRSGQEVHRLQQLGVNGFLVGEAFLTAPDSPSLVRELADACCPDCWLVRIASQG